MRFEPAEDPLRWDQTGAGTLFRLFRQQEEIPDDDESANETTEDTSRRRRTAKRLRWVIQEKANPKGGLVLHGKDAAKEEAQYMMMIFNTETKKLELTPVEQYIRFQRVVEAYGTLTKKEDIESVIKPGKGGAKRKAPVEEDESRMSKKDRLLSFAENYARERELEEIRAGGGGRGGLGASVDKNWDGKVGSSKYWRAKGQAVEEEITAGLDQVDNTRELLGFGADDPDDYVPDDDDEEHLKDDNAVPSGAAWAEEESSDEEEDEEEQEGLIEKVGLGEEEEEGAVVKVEGAATGVEGAEQQSKAQAAAQARKSLALGRASPSLDEARRLGTATDSPRSRILSIFGGLGVEVENAVMRRELQQQLKADKEGTTRTLRELANLVEDGLGQRVWKLKAEYAQRK